MNFHEKRYKSKIKFYHNTEVEEEFCKKMIDYFWFDKVNIKNKIEHIKTCDHRKIKVFKMNYKNKVFYLKKYEYQRISKKIENNLLRRPEGIRNIKIAKQLLKAGISTPKPIFSAVKRNVICYDSLFVTSEAKEIELDEYIEEVELSGNELVIKALGKFWANFIDHKFIHQDPGLDNLFISQQQKKVKITGIDIDSVYSLPLLVKAVALHTIARFIVKTYIGLFKCDRKLLTEKDLNLFLKELARNSSIDFDFDNLVAKTNKLIVKKIVNRKKNHLVDNSKFLSSIK